MIINTKNKMYMKKVLLMISLFGILAMSVKAQEIVKNEKDEFTGRHIVETGWVKLVWMSKSLPSCVCAKIRCIDGKMFLDLKVMTGKGDVISTDDAAMFLDTEKNVYKLMPTGIFHSTVGGGSINLVGSQGFGFEATYKGDLSFINKNRIEKMRIYTTSGYYEAEIKEKRYKKFSEMYDLVKDAISQ